MPYLRKVRKAKWYKNSSNTWMNEFDFEADAFVDIQTSGNLLSVFFFDSDINSLDRIAVAMCLKCNIIPNFDYTLIQEEDLKEIEIKVISTPLHGDTPDDEVNKLHYDLCELTGKKLYELACKIHQRGAERISENKMKSKVVEALSKTIFDESRIGCNPESLNKLKKMAKNNQTG